ncbi:glycogen synthase [Fusobacterium sp.]|uniref:glycogen synthase n=1 Tax=Fusobacterium sp. TaxID=68766 RepID=UPI0025C296E1|nr:glycogen/starch synthase [Fusobacterium sp.]
MKVLFATGEAWPFIKTGGLGDVAYSLPKALKEKGVDARVILPKYGQIPEKYRNDMTYLGNKKIWASHYNAYVGIESYELDGVIYYFVDNMQYFSREKIYGEKDDCERFAFFTKAIVETFDITGFTPDIIHCNDWHTALTPIYLLERGLNNIRTVFTIHNLRFQGFFPNQEIEETLEIDRDKYYQEDGLKYYDMISFLKGGVVYSDYVTTVSETYAEEIKTPEYGEGIDGLFRKFDYKLSGIVNGIDGNVFKINSESKEEMKAKLQKELGLNIDPNVPLVAIISRLDRQKGIDMIAEKFDQMMDLGIQFVLLGSGEAHYENFFRWKESQYPKRVCSYIGFNQPLSIDVYQGADIFLMPSLFEPCGLSQMIAMRYETIPLVRETGGLRDTVTPYNEYTGMGDGFGFRDPNGDTMLKVLSYALSIYKDKDQWKKIMENAKARDNSWDTSAKKYIGIYENILNK